MVGMGLVGTKCVGFVFANEARAERRCWNV